METGKVIIYPSVRFFAFAIAYFIAGLVIFAMTMALVGILAMLGTTIEFEWSERPFLIAAGSAIWFGLWIFALVKSYTK